MEIQNVNVKLIKPYEKNAKKHDSTQVDNVAESIRQFGFVQPIVLDRNNNIVIGHCRFEAAKKLKLEEVPVYYVEDLDSVQVDKLRLLDNKLNESDWDIDLLGESLVGLDFYGFDVDWGIADPNDMEEAQEDDFDVDAAIPEVPISKPGDVFLLGRHRLMCGDSTKAEDVQKLMGGNLCDLFLTDPPYNVDYEGKTKDKLKIQNDKMENDNFREFLDSAFKNAAEAMKPGACFYIWHADSEGYNFRGACFDSGLSVRQCLIWNKNTLVMGRQDYQWKHEPCLYGWKEGASHLWASDRKQTTVIDFDRPTKSDLHPTMKPIGLFDYQIKNNTKGGDIVLDLFSGSGTTIMACEQNGRNAYSMEFDPKYCDVIIKRWETFTGKKAELLNE